MQAIIHTNKGDIRLDLFGDSAPITVANFVGLSNGTKAWTDPATGAPGQGPLYNGTIFHRVISGFMIQGGDPLGKGFGGPGYEFEDEFGGPHNFSQPYMLAMANAGPGTNGSQFFITVGPTPHLLGAHTIFGEVADQPSRGVVDSIATAPTGRGDKPLEDMVIESIDILP
jgi:peptidyl-prolyl cis-trans isomerase A (cyclophilin A)